MNLKQHFENYRKAWVHHVDPCTKHITLVDTHSTYEYTIHTGEHFWKHTYNVWDIKGVTIRNLNTNQDLKLVPYTRDLRNEVPLVLWTTHLVDFPFKDMCNQDGSIRLRNSILDLVDKI